MQTVWDGFGLPTANMVWSEVFVPRSCTVVLSDTPNVITRITLPLTTHGVTMWTALEQVWYAFDEDPGPIPPVTSGTLIPATAFMAGGVLLPGGWQLLTLPNDSLQHALHLVSRAPSPTVLLTALTELA
jgi:hypothetical protein